MHCDLHLQIIIKHQNAQVLLMNYDIYYTY